jgi:hypothetical protein
MNDPNEGIETYLRQAYCNLFYYHIEMNDPNEGIETCKTKVSSIDEGHPAILTLDT